MRSLWLAFFVLAACGDDVRPVDSGSADSSGMDAHADAGGEDTGAEDTGPEDTGAEDTGAGDARDGGRDSGLDCGPECPPGYCVEGVCVLPGGCCETGFCPDGSICDFERCGCVPATGCCAGEACAVGETCSRDCRCASEDDCCFFGCRSSDPAVMCLADCTCGLDTSCGTCPSDTLCSRGECVPRCWFEGCTDPSFVCGASGCTPPLCTNDECLAHDLVCDPTSGCYDACADSDWSWCTSAGGYCWLGGCVDASCAPTGVSCSYRFDCCGNAVCQPDDAGDPFCPPCFGDPYVPSRLDLCVCGLGGYCQDLYGGGRPVPPPPPPPFP